MNILTFTTRFGQDAQVRHTAAGNAVTTVRCPVESGYGSNKHTSWVTVVIFAERGEKLAPHILKGGKATITGELKIREFESNGAKRLAVEVLMRDIELQGEPRQAGQSQEPANTGQQSAPPADDFDDSLPF